MAELTQQRTNWKIVKTHRMSEKELKKEP